MAAPVWPAAGSVDVDVAADRTSMARVGGLSVRAAAVAPRSAASTLSADAVPSRVRLQVLDRAAAQRTGAGGPTFAVSRTDGGRSTGQVSIEVGYDTFAGAYGGDYGARLRLVQLPSCALSTPDLPQCRTTTPCRRSTTRPRARSPRR